MKKNYTETLKTKSLFKNFLFSYEDFKQENFIKFIMENFILHSTNTILVTFGFNSNNVFISSGKQIGVKITENHNIEYYKNIYNIIILRIEDIISKYNMESLPNTIIISYKNLNIQKKLVIKNINSITLNKSILSNTDRDKIFSSNYLPLTINNKYFGFLIENELKYKYINQLISNILNSGMIIPDILNNSDLIKKSNIFINKVKLKNNVLDKLII
jgi:hypothetical protein